MPGVVLKPSAARRPALNATSPPALIEAHPKLNGSKLSSVLSASFVKLYSWASADGASPVRMATAAAHVNRPSLSLRAPPPANEIVLIACLPWRREIDPGITGGPPGRFGKVSDRG